ncbi:cell division ATP-binding protein FtsE [Eubacterium sp.]|uniref:cell division ATP-binding protein FtsE n=1 Tax=Eubacterium sp. TaxID=142586 RepID=UPI001E1553FD|nr:cell division ATP-binding protein FtsE [Eubacterium sp.]MBS5620987.1 cell division ATP-binding protein FtsE [Eubacterium sp.]
MISIKGVSKSYGNGAPALSNLNLEIEDGEFVFVVGASGSGKSTFIKLLLKELNPTEGMITVGNIKLSKLKSRGVAKYRRKLGVVFQDFRLLQDRDVYSNIAFAQHVIGASPREIKKNVARVLSLVGLSEKYRSNPNELSGGEQQRVALARALVNKPDILLADEPTGNLDPENSWEIMKLLDKVNKQGTTVIVVTHNLEIVEAMNKRVITMKKGVKISDSKVVE